MMHFCHFCFFLTYVTWLLTNLVSLTFQDMVFIVFTKAVNGHLTIL